MELPMSSNGRIWINVNKLITLANNQRVQGTYMIVIVYKNDEDVQVHETKDTRVRAK